MLANTGVVFILKTLTDSVTELLVKNTIMTESEWANELFSAELSLTQPSRV